MTNALIPQWLSQSTDKRTDSVALPAATSLSVAGAVHHVALLVAFGKFLVHFIVNAIDDALVCSQKRRRMDQNNTLSIGKVKTGTKA